MQHLKPSIHSPAGGNGASAPSHLALVDQRHAWPLWRRWLRVPDNAAEGRRAAWNALCKHVDVHAKWFHATVSLTNRGEGIFDRVRVRLDLLDRPTSKPPTFHEARAFTGEPRVSRNALRELSSATRLDQFSCDITDVEGFVFSKSSSSNFRDVQSFGRSFLAYKGFAVDEGSLAQALDHSEVRIVRPESREAFSLFLWDGRLFLGNAGGSHHTAAAAYIVRELGRALALRAPLWVYKLNETVWAELLAGYRVLLVPRSVISAGRWIAELCGHCHEIELPGILAEGSMLFVPRDAPLADLVVRTMQFAAATEVTDWLEAQLRLQREYRAQLLRQWPALSGVLAGVILVSVPIVALRRAGQPAVAQPKDASVTSVK